MINIYKRLASAYAPVKNILIYPYCSSGCFRCTCMSQELTMEEGAVSNAAEAIKQIGASESVPMEILAYSGMGTNTTSMKKRHKIIIFLTVLYRSLRMPHSVGANIPTREQSELKSPT